MHKFCFVNLHEVDGLIYELSFNYKWYLQEGSCPFHSWFVSHFSASQYTRHHDHPAVNQAQINIKKYHNQIPVIDLINPRY